jgi:hypothetical protein
MVSTAFAAQDTNSGATTLNVTSSITLTGLPATIDFGSGVPGDVKAAPDFTLNVLTNNTAGYELSFKASDMVSAAPVETIVANTDMTVGAVAQGLGTGSAVAPVAAANAYAQIGTSSAHSDAAGDDYLTSVSLTIPFVRSATYPGTAAAEASTL